MDHNPAVQLAAAIGFAVVYFSITLALGGMFPKPDAPWWLFVPVGVTLAGVLVAEVISPLLPVPWIRNRQYPALPRAVHLSWRTALRAPSYLPWLLSPWHLLSGLRKSFDLAWLMGFVAIIAVGVVVRIVLKRAREVRLLRNGEYTMAVVRRRDDDEGHRIAYQFTAADGTVVSGWAADGGYRDAEGSAVPVFYEPTNYKNHVLACACWFEAD